MANTPQHQEEFVRAAARLGLARDYDKEPRQLTEQEIHQLGDVPEIIVDTGAAIDIIRRSDIPKHLSGPDLLKMVPPMKLTTANGPLEAAERIIAKLPHLDPSTAFSMVVLKDSPSVISVGILCEEQGWDFVWEGWTSRPYITSPDGRRRIYLYTRNHVPLLLNKLQQIPNHNSPGIQCFQCIPPETNTALYAGSTEQAGVSTAYGSCPPGCQHDNYVVSTKLCPRSCPGRASRHW